MATHSPYKPKPDTSRCEKCDSLKVPCAGCTILICPICEPIDLCYYCAIDDINYKVKPIVDRVSGGRDYILRLGESSRK